MRVSDELPVFGALGIRAHYSISLYMYKCYCSYSYFSAAILDLHLDLLLFTISLLYKQRRKKKNMNHGSRIFVKLSVFAKEQPEIGDIFGLLKF